MIGLEDESPRFLLVDDHAVVRRGVQELLRETFPKAEFGEAATAAEALVLIRQQSWDLVVLDVSMPGISGLDIVRQVRELRPRTAVLVQSIYAEDQFALRALKAGAAGYITKDSLPRELLRAVDRVLNGGRYVSEAFGEKLAEAVRNDGQELHERLSEREFQVLRMIAAGQSPKEIGNELQLSTKTVSTYRSRILEKLRMHSNAELAQYALRARLME